MYAMEKEPLGSIHIDGDVFIKQPTALGAIQNSTADAFVQNLESKLEAAPAYVNAAEKLAHISFPRGTTRKLDNAYNTGILCFNNINLKSLFLGTDFKMAEIVIKDERCIELLNNDKSCAPDIILEQKFLYDLSKNYKVSCLLPNGFDKSLPGEIGYQHVIGSKKYLELHHCKRVLKELDIDLYNACLQKQHDIETGKIKLNNDN
jgi:hypothetical protein